jgi:hypothetical protein
MRKAVRRLVARTVLVVVAAAAAYAGWKWGDAVFPRVEAMLALGGAEGTEPPVTAETAARAARRIEDFRASEEAELRLESAEVSSLLRFSTPGVVPSGVLDPRVTFAGDRVEIAARVLPALMPGLPQLGGLTGILPDTVDVLVEGSLGLFGGEASMLVVEGMEVHGWPVPAGSVPRILAVLGREPPPGAPAAAVPVPALGGLKGAYIENGKLVLVRV